MKGSYAVKCSFIRGWNLQSRNMDVLWVIGGETVRVLNVDDDLHAIWGRGLNV